MISFRYHIVSLVSVFLALAVGVALGGGPLKGQVDNTLVDQVKADRQVKSRLRAEIVGLRRGNGFVDDVVTTVAPRLIGGTLRGRVVTLVVLPTAAQNDVAALTRLVKVAGGAVGGTLRAGTQLLDASRKSLVDRLGKQLQRGLNDVTVPAGSGPYARIGALIARAAASDQQGGAGVDASATTILAGLSTTSLLSAEGTLRRRGDLVLFVAGPGEGDTAQRQAAGTIVATLVKSVDANTGGVVLAGPLSAARGDGQVKAVRDDVGAIKDVSTVDSVGRTAGQVVAIMALAGQAAGKSGQYGAVDAADGAMPGAAQPGS